MESEGRKIKREELHGEIWKTPLTKLAVAWGIPVHEIVKACSALNIPRPGPAHWQYVARGWKMDTEALPPAQPGLPDSVVLRAARKREPRSAPIPAPQDSPASESVDKIEVPKNLDKAHPLVRATLKAFTHDVYEYNGMLRSRTSNYQWVEVSAGSLDRALRLLDVIVKGIIQIGGHFERGPEAWRLTITVAKERISITMTENRKRFDKPVESKDGVKAVVYSWNSYDWKGGGLLRFHISGENIGRQTWEETARRPLEQSLPEILKYLSRVGQLAAENIAAAKERKRLEAVQREADAVRWRREYEENERRKLLESSAQRWAQAQEVRRFIAACEAELRSGLGEFSTDSPAGRWLSWATEHADRLDPLKEGLLRRLLRPDPQSSPS